MSVTMFKASAPAVAFQRAKNAKFDKPCADVARRIISNASAIGSRAFKPTAMAVAMVEAAVTHKLNNGGLNGKTLADGARVVQA